MDRLDKSKGIFGHKLEGTPVSLDLLPMRLGFKVPQHNRGCFQAAKTTSALWRQVRIRRKKQASRKDEMTVF